MPPAHYGWMDEVFLLCKSNAIDAQSAISQGNSDSLKMLSNVALFRIADGEILNENRGGFIPGTVTAEAETA